MKSIKKQLGVTFLELLTVVALIAVLSLFSYPSYQKYVLRLNRIEIRNTMEVIAQRLEQNFSVTRDFTHYYDPSQPENRTGTEYKDPKDLMIKLGYEVETVGTVSDAIAIPKNRPSYAITLKYIDKDETYGPGFYLQANAVGKQAKDRCVYLYLNHRNVRKASRGSPDWANIKSRDGDSQECWQS